jgi:hypothetical protein
MSKGNKNVFVFGPPSSGKTSMIECLTGNTIFNFDIGPDDPVFSEVEKYGYLWSFVDGGELINNGT